VSKDKCHCKILQILQQADLFLEGMWGITIVKEMTRLIQGNLFSWREHLPIKFDPLISSDRPTKSVQDEQGWGWKVPFLVAGQSYQSKEFKMAGRNFWRYALWFFLGIVVDLCN